MPIQRPIRALALAVCAAVVLPACGKLPFAQRDRDKGAMPRTQFVQTMVGLRRAANASPSSADFARRKAEYLSQLGVSEKALQQFVAVHGGDPIYMSAVWDSISTRLEKPTPSAKPAPAK